MKTNKAVMTLLVTSALWLALALGCSMKKRRTATRSISSRPFQLSSPFMIGIRSPVGGF